MLAWLEERAAAAVDERLRDELAAALDVDASKLRPALIESGLPLAPTVEGVRQETFEALERTLLALSVEYIVASETARRGAIRNAVILARQHAGWAAKSKSATPELQVQKEEMQLWMRTWLENPPLFPAWLELRKKAIR